MEPHENTRSFETSIDIDAPRDAVWNALSDPAEIVRWFAPEARVTPNVDGEVVWRWPDLYEWPQTIEVWEPGVRLSTRYDSPVDDGAGGRVPLFVDFLLEGDGGRTTLRVVQSGFGEGAGFDEEYDGISRGWPIELTSLRLYLEEHRGRDRRLSWSRVPIDADPDTAWERLTGPEGLGLSAPAGLAPGADVRLDTVDGETFEGTVLRTNTRELALAARSHGNAFLRVVVEKCAGPVEAPLWPGAYEGSEEDAGERRARWDALLRRLFAGESVQG
jgi:uncharacterized protein YndB with AHSA1/START domain